MSILTVLNLLATHAKDSCKHQSDNISFVDISGAMVVKSVNVCVISCIINKQYQELAYTFSYISL